MPSPPRLFCAALLLSSLVLGRVAAEAPKEAPGRIRIAIYNGAGTGSSQKQVLAALDRFPDLVYTRINGEDIRSGTLEKYDVLLHPGGSGSKQAKGLEELGRDRVREFVRQGGGYVGICAGAYLASSDYSWSLNILDAKVVDRAHWARGNGDVKIRLTEKGKTLLECADDLVTIRYCQGPLLAPGEKSDVPDYEPLALFETEIAKKGAPTGVMKGATAIAAGEFGEGRVVCFSPHPEKTEGLDRLLHLAILWAAGNASEFQCSSRTTDASDLEPAAPGD